jgi:hypothetical protein
MYSSIILLTSTLDGGRSVVSSRVTGLNVVKKRKSLAPYRESNRDSSVIQPVA